MEVIIHDIKMHCQTDQINTEFTDQSMVILQCPSYNMLITLPSHLPAYDDIILSSLSTDSTNADYDSNCTVIINSITDNANP